MGVLTHRLHGSITAFAAIAAFSTSSDSSDKSGLKSLLCATGEAFLLTSAYAPAAASSFDMDTGSLNPSSSGLAAFDGRHRRWPTHVVPCSPFSSQTSSLRFHRAQSTTSTSQTFFSRRGVSHLCEDHYREKAFPGDYLPYLLVEIDAKSAYTSPLEPFAHARGLHMKNSSRFQQWRAPISAHQVTAADFPVPRLPHLVNLEKLIAIVQGAHASPPLASASLLHMWYCPLKNPEEDGNGKHMISSKQSVAVVLLGWLGAEQRHLKKYADWYTSQGIHAVTFVVPMKDLLTLKAGDKAERHVDVLTQNLVQWLKEDASEGDEKIVIFHTFSNTGWLIYGAVLERLLSQGDDLLKRIKGCVVDSAPSARPDPHVWASGFSAALLKKGSIATQMLQPYDAVDLKGVLSYPKPSFKETALLAMLENFFAVFLQIPYVNRRLNDVVSVLANHQPACPQLYIYSSADAVIPAKSVEAFIEVQKKAGHTVKACDFQFSPHVDHFRTFPERYMEQLSSFLKMCVPQWATR